MERDFMSLNSKDTSVKKEGCKQAGFFGEIDYFKAFNKHQDGEIQNGHFLQLHLDTKQAALPVMMNSPFIRPHFTVANVNQHLLKGVPVLPSTGSFFPHKTESWYNRSKVASAPAAQLTIFYGGMVNVYDGISPEKAQAIMLMAGTEAFVAGANAPQPRAQAQIHTPMTPISTHPYSTVSSLMSVSSLPVGQSTNRNETAKRVTSSLGEVMQSAIPQARKASLARFLEKRKERVMASAPYSFSKNTIDYFADSNDVALQASEGCNNRICGLRFGFGQ